MRRVSQFYVIRPTTNSWSLLIAYIFLAVTIVLLYRVFISSPAGKNFPTGNVSSQDGARPAFKVVLEPWNRIDYPDKAHMHMERDTEGNGERGKPATLPSEYDETEFDVAFRINGYNGLLSDYISIERSVPDFRHKNCRNMKYRQHLPDVSVILPVCGSRWSTLLRTVSSVLNRSPSELIKEIIIIKDNSTETTVNEEQLDSLVSSEAPKVRIIHIESSQKGLVMARTVGARVASGQILVFLDAQTEVGINWLPPLLEPFSENYKLCVCPIVDEISRETFEIGQTAVGRDAFDWNLDYKTFPLLPEAGKNPTAPYQNPVMVNGLFAITKKFFGEIGAYDAGLQDGGGEQYELSFKIWQCGGALLKAPCSRVAHVPRVRYAQFANPAEFAEFVGRNYRRVATVWMDEYAEYLYARKPEFKTIDHGDLREVRAIRDSLKCKPFKWYMDEIAFDVVKKYPPQEPPAYGSGKIRPIANDRLCVTVLTTHGEEYVELLDCLSADHNTTIPRLQEFLLSWHKDIEIKGTEKCLDGVNNFYMAPIKVYPCHRSMENQLWKYNTETQQIMFGSRHERCLTADVQRIKVFLQKCDANWKDQKWMIDSINRDVLKRWNETAPLVA